MSVRLTNRLFAIVLLALALVVTGCSGGDDDSDDGGPPVSAATSTELSTAITDVFDSVGEAMGEIQLAATGSDDTASRQAAATFDATLPCQDDELVESGHVSMSANSDFNQETGKMNFDATLEFKNCDGINGTLTFDGDGTITEQELSFTIILNGSVETPTCMIKMEAFTQTMAYDEATQDFTFTIDGKISGSCAEESFACNFKDDDIDLSASSSETQHIEENCHQT